MSAEPSSSWFDGTDPVRDPYAGPTPVDLFGDHGVPDFPIEVLPQTLRTYAEEYADQSGFDVGGYAFCLLIEAANLIDHRTRLRVTDTWSVPAFQWAAIVDKSGGGKTPVLGAALKCTQPVYDDLARESGAAYAKWKQDCSQLEKGEPVPPAPPWIQRSTDNTTVEGLADLSATTPQGVNMRMDEMSEWVGRMDAYHKGGGSQDRANYLKAYNADPTTITRASKKLIIENWSVGILTGVQPERLGSLFKRSGDASDGLFQRVLLYVFQPSRDADFTARMGQFTTMDAANLYRRLDTLTEGPRTFDLSPEARRHMQDYVNNMRIVAKRTASNRLREHINKFPGFLARLTLALHLIDAAASEAIPETRVSLDTLRRGIRVMACLYRHSEAVYADIDGQAQQSIALARSAAEAILAKGWDVFKRGDLTRDATHWRGADHLATESAVDLLIELGWIRDVTEPGPSGKRGRRSAGRFATTPKVHVAYQPHAERIRKEREDRKRALDLVAESRRGKVE